MSSSQRIRVKTDKKYRDLYNELNTYALGESHELFFLCVCLGYKNNNKLILQNGAERFWSDTIRQGEWATYRSILLKANDMNLTTIQNDIQVLHEMEQYANGGMTILIDELLTDYIIGSKDEFKIDPALAKDLPRALLYYIYNRIQ